MKRFGLTRKIDPENVNLAIIDSPPVISNESIEVSRYSTRYEDNLVPIFSEFVQTKLKTYQEVTTQDERETSRVDVTLLSKDIILTNEVVYDNNNLRVIPMWYEYSLRSYYFNKTRDTRQVSRYPDRNENPDLDGLYISNILPSGTREIILEDNTFTMMPVGQDVIPAKTYKIDFNNNRVMLLNQIVRNLNKERQINVKFDTIIPDIAVTYYDGTPLDPSYYRLVVTSYTTDPDSPFSVIYNCKLLLSDIVSTNLIKVAYDTYDTIKDDEVKEKRTEEIINATPIYQKMNYLDGDNKHALLNTNPKGFIIEGYSVYTALSHYEEAFVKYDNITSEKITVLEPQGKQIQVPWYADIQPGEFEHEGFNYSILEKNAYQFQGRTRIGTAEEEPDRLGPTLYRLQNKNIYTTFNREGDITNLQFYIDGIRRFGFVADIDNRNGLLILKKEVSANSRVVVSYSYFTTFVPYSHVNINPAKRFIDNFDIIQKNMLIYMLPVEELKTTFNRSMFHVLTYKYPSMYPDVLDWQISLEKAEQYLLGVNANGRSNLYDLIPEYIHPNAGDILHPALLASVNVNPTKTEQAIKIMDIRNRGGGLVDSTVFTTKYWEYVKDYIDIAKWDGHLLNVNNVIVLEIPQSIINTIAADMALFDTETIRLERTDPGISLVRAESYVRDVVKKYTPVTKHVHLRFV